jgi:hypothetical protein
MGVPLTVPAPKQATVTIQAGQWCGDSGQGREDITHASQWFAKNQPAAGTNYIAW